MRRLSITILVMMLLGIALAQDSEVDQPPPTTTLSCSASVFSVTAACFVERPIITIGKFELAVGVDALAPFLDLEDASLAGYGVLAYYAPTWSAWVEVAIPKIVPPLGRSDPVRFGFTARF